MMTVWQSVWAAIKSGAWVGYLGTLIGVAVTLGLLTQDQANAAAQLVSGVATLVTLIVSLVHTFHAAGLLRRNANLRALKTPAERIP
jgi:hypothetical protein